MAGPGGQHRGGHPGGGQHADDPVPQASVETHGRGVRLRPHRQHHAVLRARFFCGRTDGGDGFLQRFLVRGAGVQPGLDRRGHAVDAARLRDHLAERGQSTVPLSGLAGGEDGARVREHRVVPVGEPGGARVVGAPGEVEPPAAVRPDSLGDAHGGAQRRQRAALLHVQFDEGADAHQEIIAGTDELSVQARGRHRRGQREAGVVGEGPGRVRRDSARQQAAAQAGDAKAGALFFGPDGDSHRSFGIKRF